MKTLQHISQKPSCLVIGLMSGTCTDGIDAALVRITGCALDTKAELLDFTTIPYSKELREALLTVSRGDVGGSCEISKLNFLLGRLLADACLILREKSNTAPSSIDFVGSHGHTLYHQPVIETCYGYPIRSTLQIGEASVISEALGCPVVSDFRVRDMAAGGLGAPLVPYTEYLLYRDASNPIALQNIGGIGNITFLPAGCDMNQLSAFDTGPGNMVIDSLISIYSNHTKTYDEGGKVAASGHVKEALLAFLMNDDYLFLAPPKTTGREHYGAAYVERLLAFAEAHGISMPDVIATATMFTAKTIAHSILHFLPQMPKKLIVGGGGSLNMTLLSFLRSLLKDCNVLTNEDLGYDSNAKEAIAFAILANEAIHNICNNAPTATGAKHPVVMGKLSL